VFSHCHDHKVLPFFNEAPCCYVTCLVTDVRLIAAAMMCCCCRERKDDESMDEEQMNFKTKIGQSKPRSQSLAKQN